MKFCVIGSEKPEEIKKIRQEIESRGYACLVVPSYECELGIKDGVFSVYGRGEDLGTFDIFLFRTGGYIIPYIVELQKNEKKLFFTEYTENSVYSEKFAQLIKLSREGIQVPRTYYLGKYEARRIPFISKQMDEFGYPAILKGFPGSKGQVVFKVDSPLEIIERMQSLPEKEFILQEDLGAREDIRVIALGQEVLGGMLKRSPEGDFRTNVAQGGKTSKFDVSEDIAALCRRAVKAVRTEFAGIDIMFRDGIPYILEVNNVPQYQGFESVTGVDVSIKLVDLLLKRYEELGNQ